MPFFFLYCLAANLKNPSCVISPACLCIYKVLKNIYCSVACAGITESTMCSSRPIQLSVGSVGVPLTDCSPRSAVRITALSVKQVEPRWTHGRLQTDHRFCPAVSCHRQLKRYLRFSHLLIRHLLLQNCPKPLGTLIISFFFLNPFHFRTCFFLIFLINQG